MSLNFILCLSTKSQILFFLKKRKNGHLELYKNTLHKFIHLCQYIDLGWKDSQKIKERNSFAYKWIFPETAKRKIPHSDLEQQQAAS